MTSLALIFGAVTPTPFLSEWNFRVLHELFQLLPHSATRDAVAQFFIDNALASTWVYAGAFYMYWRINDERTTWRRTHLLALFIAFCLLIPATLALRSWVGWPAPVLVPKFRQLYPDYLWNEGNPNCFPSHSTLIYVFVAAGFWPFQRWLSALLIVLALVLISAPRVYIGGHYPIDIVAGILLAAVGTWLARLIYARSRVRTCLEGIVSLGLRVEVLLFLWLFELGEGFRSSYLIWTTLARVVRNIGN
jgi:undecaprenyl-diphosphatase